MSSRFSIRFSIFLDMVVCGHTTSIAWIYTILSPLVTVKSNMLDEKAFYQVPCCLIGDCVI